MRDNGKPCFYCPGLKAEQGTIAEWATNTQPLRKLLSLSAQLEKNKPCAAQQKPSVLNFLPTHNHTNVCIKEINLLQFCL